MRIAGKTAAPLVSLKTVQQRLVVRCDIDVRAAKDRSLERLLEANGVAWRGEVAPTPRSERIAKVTVKDQKQVKYYGAAPPDGVGREQRLYADATPAQITAILAGLAAQPKVFLAVDVGGVDDAGSGLRYRAAGDRHGGKGGYESEPLDIVTPSARNGATVVESSKGDGVGFAGGVASQGTVQFRQRTHVAGPTAQQGAVGQLDVSVNEGPKSRITVEAGSAKPAKEPSVPAPGLVSARRSVLFVLHVVDAQPPTAAASPAAAAGEAPKPKR